MTPPIGGGGGHPLGWPILGRADGQGVVFGLSTPSHETDALSSI